MHPTSTHMFGVIVGGTKLNLFLHLNSEATNCEEVELTSKRVQFLKVALIEHGRLSNFFQHFDYVNAFLSLPAFFRQVFEWSCSKKFAKYQECLFAVWQGFSGINFVNIV